jgi:exopolyphosphatase/guanosine-5'-triphosphate,3'-diphosphate pyrophosphatase
MEASKIRLQIENGTDLKLFFEAGWLAEHPLTQLDLEIEAERLKAMNFNLTFE